MPQTVRLLNHAMWGAAAFALGTAYYLMMSLSIPKHVNCSFSANIWTDILATAFGVVLWYYAYKYDNPVFTAMGTAIITEHVWQFVFNKI